MKTTHELARKTVRLKADLADPALAGAEYRVEDTWINVFGKPASCSDGNQAALKYAMRSGVTIAMLCDDARTLYGKAGPFGHLVHESEIAEVIG